jgi:hypothetical protein
MKTAAFVTLTMLVLIVRAAAQDVWTPRPPITWFVFTARSRNDYSRSRVAIDPWRSNTFVTAEN